MSMIIQSGRVWICAVATLGAVLGTGACATSTEPTQPGASQSADTGVDPTITPTAASDLCQKLQSHVEGWRGKDAVLVKTQFNGVVQEWAARNNGINIAVVRNRDVIDKTTTATCPQVRTDTLVATGTTDLASALAGF
ncbi:hypothetical protein [Nocardia spumae]|uniref:hypothetical protein n=1 Tax=Nocardia spumae TaxID=2887190 RepID=UPI001D15845C|nr:hypothetical protein [Nocardia spumae]